MNSHPNINRYIIENEKAAVNPKHVGTKMAAHYVLDVPAGGEKYLCMRLSDQEVQLPFDGFDDIIQQRKKESDIFYDLLLTDKLLPEHSNISKQCYAGKPLQRSMLRYPSSTGEQEGEGGGDYNLRNKCRERQLKVHAFHYLTSLLHPPLRCLWPF